MADYDPYGGGDYTQPRPRTASTPDYSAPAVQTSQTPQPPATQSYAPPSTPAPSQPASGGSTYSSMAQRYPTITQAYQQRLGRMPSDEEIGMHTGGGSWASNDPRLNTSVRNIYGSPEARRYQQQQAQAPPPPGGQAPTYAPYQMGQDFRYDTGGQTNTAMGQYGNALEGFESSKLNDPTRTSAKYMFGRIASKYPPTQQGFAQLMQDPEFQRLGMQSVGNGKIRLPNGDVIDVVRGFAGGGQAWQWGAETVNGQATDFGAPGQVPPYWQQQGYDPYAQWQQAQQQYQQQQQWQQQQWQQYQQQQQLYQAQQAMQQYYAQLSQQPPPYQPPYGGANPDGMYSGGPGASPDYGGYGYNEGVGVYGAPGGASYADPVTLSMQSLGRGMPMPYGYGGY